MVDLNLDGTSSGSVLSTVVSIALLLLAIQFPVLFLLNGLIGLGLGLYFLITSYVNLAKSDLSDTDKVLYNFENFMGWVTTILGAVSLIIFFVLRHHQHKHGEYRHNRHNRQNRNNNFKK